MDLGLAASLTDRAAVGLSEVGNTPAARGAGPRMTRGPVGRCGTLDAMSALLVARLHVDLQRVTSAACRPAS